MKNDFVSNCKNNQVLLLKVLKVIFNRIFIRMESDPKLL
jgi:hypothetical protein